MLTVFLIELTIKLICTTLQEFIRDYITVLYSIRLFNIKMFGLPGCARIECDYSPYPLCMYLYTQVADSVQYIATEQK